MIVCPAAEKISLGRHDDDTRPSYHSSSKTSSGQITSLSSHFSKYSTSVRTPVPAPWPIHTCRFTLGHARQCHPPQSSHGVDGRSGKSSRRTLFSSGVGGRLLNIPPGNEESGIVMVDVLPVGFQSADQPHPACFQVNPRGFPAHHPAGQNPLPANGFRSGICHPWFPPVSFATAAR